VTDESEMWPHLNGDVIFHAVVRVVDAPAVMSPGFTRPRALSMSMIRLRQFIARPGLGVLVCACPVQLPGQAGDAACCVVLVNDALARCDGEGALRRRDCCQSLFRRGVFIDSVSCYGNSVACKRSNRSVALCFAFCDSTGLRCGHFSSVLLRKNPAPCAGSGTGPLSVRPGSFVVHLSSISLKSGLVIQRPVSGQIARRELHSIVRTIWSTDQPH
jgi:hypothetical protein